MQARFLFLLSLWGFFPLTGLGDGPLFAPLFRYVDENVYSFSQEGKVSPWKDLSRPPHKGEQENISFSITDEGRYCVSDQAGHFIQGEAGEQIFPVAVYDGKRYLISEKGFPCKTIVCWEPSNGKCTPVGKTVPAELLNVIAAKEKLAGVQYLNGESFFFDPALEKLHEKIKREYPGCFPFWRENSPTLSAEWLVELFSPDRPSLWLLCDVSSQTIKRISPTPAFPLPETGSKTTITYPSHDGTAITAVLSMPPARYGVRGLPLIVFPHGGPGAFELPFYDHRVAVLNHHGFAVLQPNYRGSAGFGRQFRFVGWKAAGIRASLGDLAAGAEFLIAKKIADPNKIAILGGSWGGFCSAASLCHYPELYCCGVALFGAYDLPEMLADQPLKSHGHPALDRLQYGDVHNAREMSSLAEIDPFHNAEKIKVPLLLIHHYQDQVIHFRQSEKFFRRLQELKKEVIFFSSPGEHGFSPPEKEATAYEEIVLFIRSQFR